MPAQDIIKVVLHWSGYGEEGNIGWYYQSAGSHSSQLLTNAAGNIDTQLGTPSGSPTIWANLQALLTTAQTWDKVTVYQYDNLPGKVTDQGQVAVTHAGTGSTAAAPLQSCMVASLRTGLSGARNRGRTYMPAHTQIGPVAPYFAAGQVNAMAGLVSSLLSGIGNALSGTLNASSPLAPVVYSPTGGFVTPITTVVVDNRPDIQRRRAAQLKASYTKSQALAT